MLAPSNTMLPTKNAFINNTNRSNLYSIPTGNISSGSGNWILVQKTGTISFRLGTTDPTFIGSEGCDINIQSPSVEKRHALLLFDPKSTHFTVKDLQSSAGTYLNEQRLPPQTPATLLNHMDLLRFGYDSNVYEIRSGTGQLHTSPTGDGPLSERLRRISDIAKAPTTIANNMDPRPPPTTSSSAEHLCRHNPALQGVRGLSGSRVISPSFTLDSGRGSSSTPSSPVKEMSPLPNSVSSSTASPTPSRKMLKDGLEEFLLTRSNSHQFLNNTGSELKSSRSLCASENEIRIRKDSLENVVGAGKGKVVNPAPEFQGTAASYADALLILESDLTVPNEVFQPQPKSLLMSPGRNSPGPKSNVPDTTEPQGEDRCSVSEPNDKGDSDLLGNKKPSPMAFTVDFGGADTKKCFGIADSISRFAPRHRRNLSLTKPEEVMGSKTEEQRNVTVNALKYQRKASLGAESNGSNKHSSSNDITSSGGKCFKETDRKVTKESYNISPHAVSKSELKLNSVKPKATIMPTSSSNKHRLDNPVNLPGKKGSTTVNKIETSLSVNPNGMDDTRSEAGTYTIKMETEEVKNARNSIDCVFGTEGNKLEETNYEADKETSNPASLAWVREWAESAAQMQQSSSPTDTGAETETRFFLQETENLVSAMQERVSQKMKSRQNSDSEDESYRQREKLLRKPHTRNGNMTSLMTRSSPLFREASVLSDSGYALGYASDNSSNEGSKETRNTGVKYNRAFAIRRNRAIGYDSDGCTPKTRQSMTLPVRGVSPRPQVGALVGRPPLPSPSPPLLARNDGGRFSLRISQKSRTPSNVVTPPASLTTTKVDSASLGIRANNHLPFAPTALAAKSDLGLKKQTPDRNVKVIRKSPASGEPRSNSTLTSKEVEFENWKRRKSYNPMRAAAQGKRKDGKSVRDDGGAGDDPSQSDASASMTKSTSYVAGRFVSGNSEDEDFSYEVDEIESSHSNSPSHFIMSRPHHDDNISALAHQNVRSKNKLEALDNLVIATIHSLSSKVRTSSRCLLEKLQIQHSNDENGALLEEMVSQLKDLETVSSANSSPTKNSSRELSGTLKNLKKLEQVILVLDRVLCDDDSETN